MSNENNEENIIPNDDELEGTIHKDKGPEMEDKSFTNFIRISSSCTHYAKPFLSNNKLHKYICEGCLAKNQKTTLSPPQMVVSIPIQSISKLIHTIIRSKVQGLQLGDGNRFRSWNYLEAIIQFFPSAKILTSVYLDTGCSSTLADKDWILSQVPRSKIRSMDNPLHVRGIGTATHLS